MIFLCKKIVHKPGKSLEIALWQRKRAGEVLEDEVNTKIGLRGGSRAAATSKMERFVIINNGFQPLAIITKRSILDVVAALDPPLRLVKKRKEKHPREKLNTSGSANNWIKNLSNAEWSSGCDRVCLLWNAGGGKTYWLKLA